MSQVCWRLFSWIEGLVLKVLRKILVAARIQNIIYMATEGRVCGGIL